MIRGLVVATGLALGGLVFAGQPAAAAPMTTINKALLGEANVEKVQWRYCRRWHRACRYRWGRGWRYRRCMRRHGC